MATIAPATTQDQSFWQKMMAGIAVFIIFGFAQFALRGFVQPRSLPIYIHLHGAIMIAWLALSVVQASLIRRENLALHRRLGWIGIALAVAVVVMGSFVGIMAVKTGRQPPFFSPPYFLALTQIGMVFFAALIAAAVVNRRKTQWHRRLMLGAMVLLIEPALGRVLPMPLIMPWGEWLVLAIQLGVLAIVVRHDGQALGHVHPATLTAMGVVTLSHIVIEAVARNPSWIALATGMVQV